MGEDFVRIFMTSRPLRVTKRTALAELLVEPSKNISKSCKSSVASHWGKLRGYIYRKKSTFSYLARKSLVNHVTILAVHHQSHLLDSQSSRQTLQDCYWEWSNGIRARI